MNSFGLFPMCNTYGCFFCVNQNKVYFYSSRFQTPEKEVGLANFWIPFFQFLMAFIPAVYEIGSSVIDMMKSNEEEGSKIRSVSWWIKFVSQFIGAFATILASLMFVCCTAITICTKATSAVDPRLNRVLPNGTVVPKDNMFTKVRVIGLSQSFIYH